MAFLGLAQSIGGVCLTLTGVGATFGVSLISDGIRDLYQAARMAANSEVVDWASYWVNKGISAVIHFAASAYTAVKNAGALGAGVEAGTQAGAQVGATASSSAGTVVLSSASSSAVQEVGLSVVMSTIVKTSVSILAGAMIEQLKLKILQRFQSDMRENAHKRLMALEAKPEFYANFMTTLAFDEATACRFDGAKSLYQGISLWAAGDPGVARARQVTGAFLTKVCAMNSADELMQV